MLYLSAITVGVISLYYIAFWTFFQNADPTIGHTIYIVLQSAVFQFLLSKFPGQNY